MYVLKKIRARRNIRKKSCFSNGGNIWNNLEDELKMCKTIYSFKRFFKNTMIGNYEKFEYLVSVFC